MTLEAQVRGIFALYAQGKYAEGLAQARRIHKAAPQLAIANYCVGHGLAASQQPREAMPFLRKATQIEPRNADFLVRYGRVLLELSRIREAESVLLKAHDLNPRLPMVPWTLGMYYASIDRFDVAAGHFRKVMQADLPAEAADSARMDWANALIQNGNTEEAKQVLRENLGRPAVRGAALVMLSSMTPLDMQGPDYRLLEEELARPNLGALDRSSLLVARSRSLKAAGDLDGEYAALQASKDARGSNYDLGKFAEQVDAIIAAFSAENLKRLASAAGPCPFRPIYVVGLPRSGTTLTEKILSRHEEVAGAGELPLMGNAMSDLLGARPVSELPGVVSSVEVARLRDFRRDIEATMRFLCPGKERIVDKMPHNFLSLGLVSVLFPEAQIVNCTRHPADNLLSGFKANLKVAHAFFDRPEWFIGYYGHYRRLLQHWHDVLPGRIHTLRYEALVTDPRKEIGDLLSFCGLPWQEDCLHPEDSTSRIGTASVMQARNPINAGSVGGWKKYASRMQSVVDALGDG